MDKRPTMRPDISEVLLLIPTTIKHAYIPQAPLMKIIPQIISVPPPIFANTIVINRPIKVNSKDKIGSISKHPDRFKMYLFENSKLTTSRSLCMKPMPNLLRNFEIGPVNKETKPQFIIRPSSGVIRRDLDMDRIVSRPASAYSNKRTTIRDLVALEDVN